MVVMEMLKCIWILSVTFLHCIVLRSEEVFFGQKVPEAILFMVVMETAYTPSFTSMHCMVYKFEK